METREFLLLIGPNRRCECTVIEQQLMLSPTELALSPLLLANFRDRLVCNLKTLGLPVTESGVFEYDGGSDNSQVFASLFSATALCLQNAVGHRVSHKGQVLDSAGQGVWVWFEYEHDEIGEQASKLALLLLNGGEPGNENLGSLFSKFQAAGNATVLPTDSEAIIKAAQSFDVPCTKLERAPYQGVQGDFRIRTNSLLKLGHCQYQHIVDGTFCVTANASLTPLVRNPEAIRQKILSLNVVLPRRDPDSGNCIMARRAIRAARRIGFPVVVKPVAPGKTGGVSTGLMDDEQVRTAVELARRISSQVVVESHVPGKLYQILVANHQLVAVLDSRTEVLAEHVHPSIVETALMISSRLGCGMLVMSVRTPAIGQALADTNGAVIDVDLAPELDKILPAGSSLLDQAAGEFVRFLYPDGNRSRIPIVAVTGTNGKTTTTRMITRIAQKAGQHTGMVCSDGVYLDESFNMAQNEAGLGAHHQIFENPQVDFAVLEEYFGRIARTGFAFSWCNVAVCTNVTEDHLGRIGTHTLEQMAELKSAIVVRARDGVVLNADNPACLAMLDKVVARKVCLISSDLSPEQIQAMYETQVCFCVLDTIDGKNWLVIIEQGDYLPVMPVDEIPATFSGTARHNIQNAQCAAAASYLAGIPVNAIQDGLSSFAMDIDTTPGRLNIFDGLSFRVILDYAHNADGFRKISDFVDRQTVSGRKILMVGYTEDRRDADILAALIPLAGHFHHYVCRNFRRVREGGRPEHEIPNLLKSGLISAGVAESDVSIVPVAETAVDYSLAIAAPGDLVVLLVGSAEFKPVWQLLTSMAAGGDDQV